MVTFGVLGPLTAADDRGPVDLKGPRHRAVLARLLVARGRVVPVDQLIDDLWDEAPAGALGALQTFVGALRKALEPDRPKRTPSRLLVTAPPGYAVHADTDAARFEAAVVEAARLPARDALDRLDAALALWRGPAYAEFAAEPWARGEITRLDELRLLAVERRAEAALATGQAAESVPALEAHVREHPLAEDGWRLLALALYRAGRQGDALATLRRARAVLRTELGVDPGERLRQLEADVLAQAPHLTAHPTPEQPFVGRAAELAVLLAAATAAAARPHLALVAGEAGAGKTALVTALTRRLAATGWTVVWGASPELPGAPVSWPWPVAEPVPHRRHEAARAHLATIAPAVVVLDDLHWADEDTLALLTALATQGGPVLLVGTYRSTEVGPLLTEALGRLARTEPTRVQLGGLTEQEVAEMVAALAVPAPAADIHARSGGNPFFVRELTRLWSAEGDAALHTVPPGVRDVLRHRLSRLPDAVQAHLRLASVLGQDVELAVLIAVAGDEQAVLDSVEAAVAGGFVVEPDATRLRFTHALVRETLYDGIARARRTRWHAAAAEALADLRPADVAAIAHHLLLAEDQAPADRVAHYATAAAELAEARSAPHEAARWWQAAVDAHTEVRARLTAVMGLVRALAVTGSLGRARAERAAAADAAEAIGDPVLTADVLGAFDVPAIWTTNDDDALSARLVAAARRTLAALPVRCEEARARLLITIAMERRGTGGREAEQAEAYARRVGDPMLLAYALNGRYMQTFHRAGLAAERARLGAELVELAGRHDGMVAFAVLGHLILVQSHAALADLAAADRHAAAADELAERHDLPLVGVFTEWYAALRLAITGRPAAAAYRAAAVRLADAGMPGVERGLLPLALLSIGHPPADADWGPYAPWTTQDGPIPDSPRDLLFEVRTCLHARRAVAAGDRATMKRLYEELLPAAHELAAGSGLVSLGPNARYLAELAAALGDDAAAARHRAQSDTIVAKIDTVQPRVTGY
jgi:DNA-binding SARP family transcriptional activator